MATYLITYDLHNVRNYVPLYQLLHQWKAVRLTESNWLAVLLGPADEVRDCISAHLDNDDTVAVLELKTGADWATRRVSEASVTWLSNNITPAVTAQIPVVRTPPPLQKGVGIGTGYQGLFTPRY